MSPTLKPLVVFEMANNHLGSLQHGLAILRAFGARVAPFRDALSFGFKLQYRDLDTFIHPTFQTRTDLKFVKRFQETRLPEAAFLELRAEMERQGFIPVCTPFDEASVDRVEAHGFHCLKIASCSLGDWPLMERVARSPLPIIASTAGVPLEVIDSVVSFFAHRERPLTLLHCVGEYPTPADRMQLNQIDVLRSRYPALTIGFSTHEDPASTHFIPMAVAKGARVFEKHVGLPLPDAPLNAYSADPDQAVAWLQALTGALEACGERDGRYRPSQTEGASLHALRRGVFVREDVPAGTVLDPGQLLLAMPTEPGQLTANDLSKYAEFRTLEPLKALDPVFETQVSRKDHREAIHQIVQRVRALLQEAHAVVSTQAEVEISHHYGLEHFHEAGATLISVVNRSYCKKLIILLPGQRHPEQFHRLKEETFHVLHGGLKVTLDGEDRILQPGDILTVERGVRHAFTSEGGTLIEEISSTHHPDDSYYTDPAIALNRNRKTQLTYFFG